MASQKETIVIQPSIFRCDVSFGEGSYCIYFKYKFLIWFCKDQPKHPPDSNSMSVPRKQIYLTDASFGNLSDDCFATLILWISLYPPPVKTGGTTKSSMFPPFSPSISEETLFTNHFPQKNTETFWGGPNSLILNLNHHVFLGKT